jgi:hypothetical protein
MLNVGFFDRDQGSSRHSANLGKPTQMTHSGSGVCIAAANAQAFTQPRPIADMLITGTFHRNSRQEHHSNLRHWILPGQLSTDIANRIATWADNFESCQLGADGHPPFTVHVENRDSEKPMVWKIARSPPCLSAPFFPSPPRGLHVGAAGFRGTADTNGFADVPCLMLRALPPRFR